MINKTVPLWSLKWENQIKENLEPTGIWTINLEIKVPAKQQQNIKKHRQQQQHQQQQQQQQRDNF